MLHFTFFADSLSVTSLIYSASGLVLQIGVGVAVIFIIRAAVETVSFLGKVSSRVGKTGESLTQKARDRAQQGKFYQRREYARNFKKQERARASSEDVAEQLRTSASYRRRAAGRGNDAGQNRAYVSGLAALQKAEEEEAHQADTVLKANDVQGMGQLGELLTKGTTQGSHGAVSIAGNPAIARAAIRRIIQAQDAEQLERVYMSGNNETLQILRNEVSSAYPTAKGAGAHLVEGPVLGGTGQVSATQLDRSALVGLAKLSPDKLAAQDGPAMQAAARGYDAAKKAVAAGSITDPAELAAVTTAIADLERKVGEVRANANSLNSVKQSARTGFDAIDGAAVTVAGVAHAATAATATTPGARKPYP